MTIEVISPSPILLGNTHFLDYHGKYKLSWKKPYTVQGEMI